MAKAVLVGAMPPLDAARPTTNPGGVPIEVFDEHPRGRARRPLAVLPGPADGPFYGANRPGAKVSQGVRDSFWLQGMQAGSSAAYDCIKAFSETDFTEDLKKFDVPTLIIHGDDDQIVPIEVGALLGEARQGRDAQGLSGRAARPVIDAQEAVQRRPPGFRAPAVYAPGRRGGGEAGGAASSPLDRNQQAENHRKALAGASRLVGIRTTEARSERSIRRGDDDGSLSKCHDVCTHRPFVRTNTSVARPFRVVRPSAFSVTTE